ncbi:MAG: hypothetical protein JSW03_01770 [Candidatus Eiseniibacteriota bacterium]|nr:MAG: hypothetical protein JSW03_01770 [Candidatus Eisenbacteria bacterium]
MKRADSLERTGALFAGLCCLLVLLAYLQNVNSGPFEDDFGWITMALAAEKQGSLSIWCDALGCFFFRPFNVGLVLASMQAGSWAVAHGTALLLHVLLSITAAWMAGRLISASRSRWFMFAVGCAFFVHQGAPTTVLQLDTLSQSTSDFFSVAAVVAAFVYSSGRARWLLLAAVATLLAMAGKEGGISTPLAVAVTVLLFASSETRLRRTVYAVGTQALAALAYALWRTNVRNLIAPPEEVLARYDFGAGLETLRHFGQFVFVEIVPWNSASLLWNQRLHEWVLGTAVAFLVIIAACSGWRRLFSSQPGSKRTLVWLLSVFVLWCTPFVFLSKVSEQEAYRLGWVTALVVTTGCLSRLKTGSRRAAMVVLFIWCAWIGINATGSVQKSALLRHNSLIVAEMLQEVKEALGDVSETSELWVSVAPSRPPVERYSVLYVPEPALRWRSLLGLRWHLKKPDLAISFFLPDESMPGPPPGAENLKRVHVDIVEGRARLLP